MNTLEVLYVFKPVDKTYVVWRELDETGKTTEVGSWESEKDLGTNDEIADFAKSQIEPGKELEVKVLSAEA